MFPFDTVLVTGGAGFIGSRVVPLLEARGVRQVVVDNGYVGLPLPEARDGVVPVNADIRNAAALAAIMREHRPGAVLHLAAVHHIPTCEAQPHLAMDVNVLGTQVVLDTARGAGCGNVVFTSSGAVYDWVDAVLVEDEAPLRAADTYSVGKLAGEGQVAHWATKFGARAHIARLFNTIGTGDPNGHLIPDVVDQLVAGDVGHEAVIRLGNTAPKRDYVHVDDVAAAFVALLEGLPEGAPVEAFNICSGREASVAELVGEIADLLERRVRVETEAARVRKVDRLRQLGSPEKIAARRGWRARLTLRAALREILGASGHL